MYIYNFLLIILVFIKNYHFLLHVFLGFNLYKHLEVKDDCYFMSRKGAWQLNFSSPCLFSVMNDV